MSSGVPVATTIAAAFTALRTQVDHQSAS